ncbi:integrase [Pelagivirga sediminicola]|uniref:Integrase n=1 Tax=Pelagivirga sediminicola TaxID=2170575 RepID=A0A2T7G549_9RHOB|nr:integrase [Pelagivirga sediminicola]PVA09535.1 integrase [Pelagivirga sediminicola]
MQTPDLPAIRAPRPARNKERIVGQERPLSTVRFLGVELEDALAIAEAIEI